MKPAATYPLRLQIALLLLIVSSAAAQIAPSSTQLAARANMGVRFTPNMGQIVDADGNLRPDIRYITHTGGMALYMASNRISYVFKRLEGDMEYHRHADGIYDAEHPEPIMKLYRMDLEFIGANPEPEVVSDLPGTDYTNYYLVHLPESGLTHIPSFGRVTYRNLYPNIDFVMRGNGNDLKYDFVVHPGGRVSDIRMRYVGATGREIDGNGRLVTSTPLGTLAEDAPYTFQERPSDIDADMPADRRSVPSRYRMADGVISFAVDDYDTRRTLVIDPTQKWSTYYGGTGAEDMNGGDGTEVDRSGSCLLAGSTDNSTFPTSTGAFQTTVAGSTDIVVVKLSGTGARLWATIYGGSGQDLAHGIVSDNDRNIFIAGHTFSSNFPVSTGAHQTTFGGGTGNRDAFAVKFDSNGVRQWGTYYGGNQFDDSYGFAIDSSGNPAMIGTTGSSSAISTSGSFQSTFAGTGTGNYDAFVVKFNGAGVRQWGTYVGGTGLEYGYGAATDISDNVNITGWTNSTNFPVTSGTFQTSRSGGYDAFIVRFNSAGTRMWGTYFGGTGNEGDDPAAGGIGFSAIATDGEGNPIIAGVTTSTNLPVSSGVIQTTFGGGTCDAYIAKFDTLGGRLWSTYYGGSAFDLAQGVASNVSNGVLITGHTFSTNLPGIVTGVSFQTSKAGTGTTSDAFILKLNSTGTTRQYVTYYGGTANDEGVGISFDPFGSIVFGGTCGTGFPTTTGAYQTTYGGGTTDAFLALFCDIEGGVIDSSGLTTFCRGDSVTLFVPRGYTSYLWQSRTNASISTETQITVRDPGDYWVKLTNGAGCVAYSDTIEVRWHPEPDPLILPSGTQTFCSGDSVTFSVESRPFASYEWYDATLTTRLNWTQRTLKVKQSGTFRVIVTDFTGCIDTSNAVTVIVNPKPDPITISPPGPIALCQGESVTLVASSTSQGQVRWSNGRTGPSIVVTTAGTYTAMVVDPISSCFSAVSNSVRVKVNPLPPQTPIGRLPTTFCEGDSTIMAITNRDGLVSVEWNVNGVSRGSGDSIHLHQTVSGTLTVVDTNGCSRVSPFNVVMVTRPTPKLIGDTTICQGDSVELDAGGGYSRYQWSTGEATQRIWAKNPGDYFVSVIDASGASCEGKSDTFTLKVTPRPSIFLAGPRQVCVGSTARYSVPLTSGVTYTWTLTGSGTRVSGGTPADTSIDVQWGGAGGGVVTVTAKYDTSNCPATSSINVVIGTSVKPSVSARPKLTVCEGDSVTLDAGTFTTYTWRDQAGNVVGTGRTLVVKAAGTFTVDVADATGCTGTSDPTTVGFDPLPTPTISVEAGKDLTLCPGDTVILDAGVHTTYNWTGGRQTRTFPVTAAGDYQVTVTGPSGCPGTSAIVHVTMENPPAPIITGPGSACINSTQTYTVSAPGNSRFTWTVTPATAGTITGPANGSSVQITWVAQGTALVAVRESSMVSGCTGDALPLPVAVSDKIVPEITTSTGQLRVCDGGSIVLRSPGHFSYIWTDASGATLGTLDTLVVTKAGDYTLTVSDGSCSGSSTISITVRPPIIPTVSPSGTASLCPGDSLVVTGEDGYDSYQWTRDGIDLPGETSKTLIVRVGGSYTVRVVDRAGCPGESGTIQLTVFPGATVPTITAVQDEMTSSPASTYQWNRNGVPIPGATGRVYTAPGDGSYTVTITDANGCSATSEPYEPISIASATVGVHTFQGSPGEKVTIPITLSRSVNLLRNDVGSFTAKLRFNKTMLLPESPLLVGVIEGDDRVISIGGDLPAGFTGDSTSLLLIDFTVALGNATSTPLELEDFVWLQHNGVQGAGGPIMTETFNGVFQVTGLCENGGTRLVDASGATTLKPARPNPTGGITSIEYEVVENGRTQLLLVDMLGRTIPIVDAVIEAGHYVASFDASTLPSGSYYCILQTPTTRLTRNVTIQK